jgi:arylformamidase
MAIGDRAPTWIDISVPIGAATPTFEGDPTIHLELAASIAAGAICNVSRLDFGVHSGTHIDAPVHFIDGAPGIEAVPLDACVGPAVVVDASEVEGTIDAAAIARLAIPDDAERILFRGRNSELWAEPTFQTTFIGVSADGAAALVERGVRLVGIDYLSIAPFGDPTATHRTLLEAGVVIVEGLDLREVRAGRYDLICLPILIPGSDGAPARAMLRRIAP